MMKKDLDLVYKYQKEMTLLEQANALLNWDEETYMPQKGIQARGEQAAYLSALVHEKAVSEEFFSALKRLKSAGLKKREKLMVDKLHKDILKSRKLPREFVEEFSRATTLASHAWREARKKNSFEVFRPHLQKIVDLSRERSRLIKLPGHPYNSLLDDYEEGMTTERLKPIFEKLKLELIELLKKIESSEIYKKQKRKFLHVNFPEDKQMMLVRDVADRMGIDNQKARIDLSEHPFTTKVGTGDVRFTTNFRKDPLFSFGSTVHEAGHALYELGMPEKDIYNILGNAPSLGLHESQSRFWENMIGKSLSFWRFYFPKFNKTFKLNTNFKDWYREVNYVFPGKIRIESDEVHYCLHVILRFEIELGLLDGSIKVRNLPKIWDAKMKEMFGVTPKNYVEGVLQDVHWSFGNIGYFPTYAIGTMYSAQIYEALKKRYPGIEKDIGKGKFLKIKNFLNKNIHSKGNKYLADEVIKQVCGEGLNPDVYVRYLNQKYGKIYGL